MNANEPMMKCRESATFCQKCLKYDKHKALRAQSKFNWHLSNLVAFVRLNLFVKIELQLSLNNPLNEMEKLPPKFKQGVLF